MPLTLPPAHTPLPSDALADHVRQALGPSGKALAPAYQRAAEAMGVNCLGVNVLAFQGDLPKGLHALLSRYNPALAQAVGRAGGVRFVYAKPGPAAIQALEATDRQALGWLVDQGLLQALPGNTVIDTGQGGLTRTMPGFPDHSQISLDSDVRHTMGTSTLPFSDRLDPVLFRWLSLFHEAGHAQRAMDEAPFQLPNIHGSARVAINQLIRGPTSHQEAFGAIFDESYADAFAVLSLLRLTHATPAAWAVVNFLRQARHDGEHHPRTAGFDPHSATHSLDRLLRDLQEDPERLAQLEVANPRQIRQWASRYASWGAGRWAHAQSASEPALGWTQVIPDPTETKENQILLRSVFFEIQDDKMTAYLRARVAAYATSSSKETLPPPLTDGDPLLVFLASHDAHFQKTFEAIGSRHTHDVAARILDAPPFGQLGQRELDRAFEQLPEVARVHALMTAAAGHFFDDELHVKAESDFQSQRGHLAIEALRQSQAPVELWGAASSPALTAARRMRR